MFKRLSINWFVSLNIINDHSICNYMNGFLNLVWRKYIGPPHVAVPQAPTDQETALGETLNIDGPGTVG